MVYFESQESSLCGQHALNGLLQGPYFSASDLSSIALSLDVEEKSLGIGQQSADSRSNNCNDSGFFSLATMERALQAFSLTLVPVTKAEGKK